MGSLTQIGMNFDVATLTVAPSVHQAARETSALAAVENLPHRSTQNERVLALITLSGEDGMSDAELQRATGYPRQTICLRRFDLRHLLTVGTRRAKSPSGRAMCTWRRRTAEEMA